MPYDLWGLSQGAIVQVKYELPYPSLKYLKVDKATFNLFSTIKEVIEKKSSNNHEVYLYPDRPIFYQLHNNIPPTHNIVQWYDVISTQAMKKEISYLHMIKPNVIILLKPQWFVYKGHSKLKQSNLYQIEVIDYLDNAVVNGDYKLTKYQIYSNEIFGDNMGDYKMVKMTLRVMNHDIVGKTIDELYENKILKGNYRIVSIISHSYEIIDIKSHKLLMGDKIIILLSYILSRFYGLQNWNAR